MTDQFTEKAHAFNPGHTGLSERCNALVVRDGAADECGMPREHHLTECATCGEADEDRCIASRRSCGHHCNHVWTHDRCDWCGVEFDAEGVAISPAPASLQELGAQQAQRDDWAREQVRRG